MTGMGFCIYDNIAVAEAPAAEPEAIAEPEPQPEAVAEPVSEEPATAAEEAPAAEEKAE